MNPEELEDKRCPVCGFKVVDLLDGEAGCTNCTNVSPYDDLINDGDDYEWCL